MRKVLKSTESVALTVPLTGVVDCLGSARCARPGLVHTGVDINNFKFQRMEVLSLKQYL